MTEGYGKKQESFPVNKRLSNAAGIAGGIALGAALMLTATFNCFAHVPDEKTNRTQHDLLAPYAGVIMHMERADGGHCCGMQDGVGKVTERHTDDTEVTERNGDMHPAPAGTLFSPGGTHYHVKLTKGRYGEDLPGGGLWLDIPDQTVLDIPQFLKEKALHGDDPTFKAPPFNILWSNNNYPTASMPDEKPFVYCFWPTPHLQ